MKCREHPNQIIEKWPDGYWHCLCCPHNTVVLGDGGWAFICDVCGCLADDFVCEECTWQLDEKDDINLDFT